MHARASASARARQARAGKGAGLPEQACARARTRRVHAQGEELGRCAPGTSCGHGVGLSRHRPGVRVEQQRVQRPDREESLALERRLRGDHVDELALQRAARVHDQAGDGRGLLHLEDEIHELLGHAGVGGQELEAVVTDEPVPGVQPPEVVRDGGGRRAGRRGPEGQQAAFHLGLRKARAWRNCLINWQGAVAQLASVHVALARPRE